MTNHSPEPFTCADSLARCDRTVQQDGDFCAVHDIEEPDWDAIRKDRIIDGRQ